jgi:hypothetical protein
MKNKPTPQALSAAQILTRSDDWEEFGIGRDEEIRLALQIDKVTKLPELLNACELAYHDLSKMGCDHDDLSSEACPVCVLKKVLDI